MTQLKIFCLAICLFFFNIFLLSANKTVDESLQWLQDNIGVVKTDGETFKQEFSYQKQQPKSYVTIVKTEINKRGKSTKYKYNLNLADVEPETIEKEVNDEWILVRLFTHDAFIQQYVNGQQEHYVDYIELIVKDTRQARDLIENIQQVAKNGKTGTQTWQDQYKAAEWLKNNAGEILIGDQTVSRSVKIEIDNDYLTTISQTRDGESNRYEFFFYDIDFQELRFEPRDNHLLILFRAKNKKPYIKHFEDGKFSRYIKQFELKANHIEQARNFINACKKISKKTVHSRPSYSYPSKAINYLNNTVTYNTEDESLNLEIDSNQLYYTQLKRESARAFGNTSTETKGFYIDHINPSVAEVHVEGDRMILVVPTKKDKRLIQEFHEGALEDFTDVMELKCDNLKEAREVQGTLLYLASKGKPKPLKLQNAEAALQWLSDAVGETQTPSRTFQQSFEFDNKDDNKVTIKIDEDGGRTSSYEFYLEDIDVQRLKVEQGGGIHGADFEPNTLQLTIPAKEEDELITYYQNGKRKEMLRKTGISFTDPMEALRVKEALYKAIRHAEGKNAYATTALQASAKESDVANPFVNTEVKNEYSVEKIAKKTVKTEVYTDHNKIRKALEATKSALMKEKFNVKGGIQGKTFSAKRTTWAGADYYTADVLAQKAEDRNKTKVQITFVKSGTGLLNLSNVGNRVAVDLASLNVKEDQDKKTKKTYAPSIKKVNKKTFKLEAYTNHASIDDALMATKNILLKKKFIKQGPMREKSFTSKRTTMSEADYYIADVAANETKDGKKIEINITFVKVGTGFLNLQEKAREVLSELESLNPSKSKNASTTSEKTPENFESNVKQINKKTFSAKTYTDHESIKGALRNVKNILLSKQFINTKGIQDASFSAKRTTGADADYYTADVSASEVDGADKIKIKITYVKVGTGFLNLEKVAKEVNRELAK